MMENKLGDYWVVSMEVHLVDTTEFWKAFYWDVPSALLMVDLMVILKDVKLVSFSVVMMVV